MGYRVLFALCLLPLLWLGKPSPLYAAEILIIESYHATHPWVISNSLGLNARLAASHQLHFFYLNAKRLSAQQLTAQAELAWRYYLELKPSIVLLCDDNAIDLLAKRIAAAGPPVVYLGMNANPRQNGLYGYHNITGVLERPMLKRNISEMSNMQGHVQKALVLFDASPVSQTAVHEAFSGETHWRIGKLQVDIQLTNSYSQWQAAITQARQQGYQQIFLGLYHTLRDAADQPVDAEQALAWAGNSTTLPLYAFWDFSIGPGKCVGGLVLSGYEQGAATSELVKQVLLGSPSESLPPRTATRGEYLFSRQEMTRWQLTLPTKLTAPQVWRE